MIKKKKSKSQKSDSNLQEKLNIDTEVESRYTMVF